MVSEQVLEEQTDLERVFPTTWDTHGENSISPSESIRTDLEKLKSMNIPDEAVKRISESLLVVMRERVYSDAHPEESFPADIGTYILEVQKRAQENVGFWPQGSAPSSALEVEIMNKQDSVRYGLPSFDSIFGAVVGSKVAGCVRQITAQIEKATANSTSEEIYRNITGQLEMLDRIADAVKRAKVQYVNMFQTVIPELRHAVEDLNARAMKELRQNQYYGEYVIGNGADPIYWAVRANRWKTKGSLDGTHMLDIRLSSKLLRKRGSKYEAIFSHPHQVREFLLQRGVDPRGNFIDTAWYGNIAAAMIRALQADGADVSDRYINKHISLMRIGRYVDPQEQELHDIVNPLNVLLGGTNTTNSWARHTEGIKNIGSGSADIKILDESVRSIKSVEELRQLADGRYWPVITLNTVPEQIVAYAIQQSVIREFLPRL